MLRTYFYGNCSKRFSFQDAMFACSTVSSKIKRLDMLKSDVKKCCKNGIRPWNKWTYQFAGGVMLGFGSDRVLILQVVQRDQLVGCVGGHHGECSQVVTEFVGLVHRGLGLLSGTCLVYIGCSVATNTHSHSHSPRLASSGGRRRRNWPSQRNPRCRRRRLKR